ncbi:PRC-barrel domain-containing protein (plasmid) [Skermanella rosea]|uniref:PRC-barrel domain-containing protein n=1 Tax=Skermanella rosea TaxID=1817965 RepID=UPI00193368E0|nr:PRC-barrel domain-containing protein [Skermanella rosea]UEM06841.1 PRC-barrel domain-containing protein [Skermanella rosea]
MRSSILCTASILALLAGPALAQTTEGTAPADPATTAPGMAVEAPSGSPAMGTAPDTSAEAARDQPADTTAGTTGTGTGTGTVTAISVDDMMGKTVRGSDGESLGSVEDVIIDPQSGEARQLVISSGGFLGIGAKQIAVDMTTADLTRQDDDLLLPNMTQADVEALPEFEMEEGMVSFNNRPDTAAPGAATGTTTQ